MDVTTLPVTDLLGMASPYNPRSVDDDALGRLQRSIEAHGFVVPLVVNERTRHIVGGHQRVIAAERAGLRDLPVILVRMSVAQEKATNVALNAPFGEWDTPKLQQLLRELDHLSADLLADTILPSWQIDQLLATLELGAGADDEESAPKEAAIPTVTLHFDDEHQQNVWYTFLGALRAAYPDAETIGGRVAAFARDARVQGLLDALEAR